MHLYSLSIHRFSKENKSQIQPYTFIPFGAGPRNCIGSRFAMLETKIAVARIISEYELKSTTSQVNICGFYAVIGS